MCTGHANTYALRVSLSRHVGTPMLGPCICTLSKDMRIGKDARMSHVQDASAAVFVEYPSSLQFRKALWAPVSR